MEIILWRHAEAEPTSPDEKRRLTEKGRDQASKMARWLKERVPHYDLVSSPATRAAETARHLDENLTTLPDLYHGASAREVLEAVGWPRAKGVVILVGHQPLLGEIAAFLMTRRSESWSLKKGAIFWFSTEETARGVETDLLVALPPKLAGGPP